MNIFNADRIKGKLEWQAHDNYYNLACYRESESTRKIEKLMAMQSLKVVITWPSTPDLAPDAWVGN